MRGEQLLQLAFLQIDWEIADEEATALSEFLLRHLIEQFSLGKSGAREFRWRCQSATAAHFVCTTGQ